MSLPPDLVYFCELLSNIRQVSISISTISRESSIQHVAVHPSRRALIITYVSSTIPPAQILLPCAVHAPLTPLPPSTSYRLPISSSFVPFDENENKVPWCAPDLNSLLSFNCIYCSTRILPSKKIKEWKDLPSENWADLMDFWHCHKPDVRDDDGKENGKTGGYSRLGYAVAQEGIGLVDMMYFLLDKHDVQNLQETDPQTTLEVQCTNCSNTLGLYDEKADGYRIAKWSLSVTAVTDVTNDSDTSFPTSAWVIAQLLALVENQGQRRFTLKKGPSILKQKSTDDEIVNLVCENANEEHIVIWLFNPHTIISSNHNQRPIHAAKLYYRIQLPRQVSEKVGQLKEAKLNGNNDDFDNVHLPARVYDNFARALEASNEELPQILRDWGGSWKSAWLERFWDL